MTTYTIHCTNRSGFHGDPGTSITAQYDFATNHWNGGSAFLGVTTGSIAFGSDHMILNTDGGKPVAKLYLKSSADTFDTIPVGSYIGMIDVKMPVAGSAGKGWRWKLFSRIN